MDFSVELAQLHATKPDAQALKAADFQSIRGGFTFDTNQYPIQDIYMRQVQRTADGKLQNKPVGTTLTTHADVFASRCKMP